MSRTRKKRISQRDEKPIQLFADYLPDALHSDAVNMAKSMAEKLGYALELTKYAVHEFGSGFVYEIHEGGAGKALMPSVLKFYEEKAGTSEEDTEVFIESATRYLQVSKEGDRISCFLMPESFSPALDGSGQDIFTAKPNGKMSDVLNKHERFLKISGMIFVSMCLVLVVSTLFKHKSYTPPPEKREVSVTDLELPINKYPELESVAREGKYVTKLEFADNKWDLKTEKIQSPSVSLDSLTVPSAVSELTGNLVDRSKIIVSGTQTTIQDTQSAQTNAAPVAIPK